jgi:hypothetical protein
MKNDTDKSNDAKKKEDGCCYRSWYHHQDEARDKKLKYMLLY